MALRYTIDPARNLVTISGDYAEDDEWRHLLRSIVADPAYRQGSSFLRDLRDSEHPVTTEVVMRIISVVREFWPQLQPHRAAMVTGPGVDAPAFVAHALAEDQHLPLRAFSSYDDAVEWLERRDSFS